MAENRYKREIAWRIFSDDLKDVTILEKADEEFAPQYVMTKSGAKVNRVFIVGTLIDLDDIGTDTPFWKLRINDPKGVFTANIGQYSPNQAQDMVETLEYPCYVAIIGKIKAREHDDTIYSSIAVESITLSDVETCERWIAETEELTKARMENLNSDV